MDIEELDTFLVRGDEVLTMPRDPGRLDAFDPTEDLDERDSVLTGRIEDGGLFIRDGEIEWVGRWEERPEGAEADDVAEVRAGVVTPGLIDCHTHAVFAGERSHEFALRNAGADYVEILESGGGILDTVESTRSAHRELLVELLVDRVLASVQRGVTTLEVKSGYGLSEASELKQLRAIEEVRQREVPCELVSCFLGAHAVPNAFEDRRDAYLDLVCDEMIPAVADEGLADYCDVFCDRGAFAVDEAERVLRTGQNYGMTARIHADELTDSGGAMLAAQVGASSADHLEHTSREARQRLADEDVTAVLMPLVNHFLHTTESRAPARDLLEAGCEVALASDFNPGSSMTQDLGLVMNLACTMYGLTPGEALRGVTVGGAKALDREDIGRLEPGARADVTLFDAPTYRYIPYHVGENHVSGVIQNGQIAYWSGVEG